MMNDDDATSKPRKVNFFDENRTVIPRQIIRLPPQKSSSTSAAHTNIHDATSDLRAIHEYDFFDKNRTGPRLIHHGSRSEGSKTKPTSLHHRGFSNE